MKRIVTIFIIVLASLSAVEGYGQQDPLVSQYMFNGLFLNPAYAGSKPYVMTTFLHRSQWVGWKGAPMTQVITAHGPLKNKKNALGGTLSNDYVGVANRLGAYFTYAYHIKFNDKAALSLGLKGGFAWYNSRVEDLIYWDDNDEVFMTPRQNKFIPNFGAGVYFYTPKFFAGISAPHILSYDQRELLSIDMNSATTPKVRRHYFLTAGYAWEINPFFVVKPSAVLRYVANAPLEADFNLNVLLYRRLWVGASYRTNDAVVGIVQFLVTRRLSVGYSYDFTLTEIRGYSSGSHEVMIGFDFGYDILKLKTPRYF